MKKKGDISDFECHKVADMLVWVFQNLMIYGDLAAQPSLGLRENHPKMRTYPLRRSYLGKNTREEQKDYFKFIRRQIN